MPFIATKTNVAITSDQEAHLRRQLGDAITLLPGKTEQWLMLEFEDRRHMAFAGTTDACAMVRVTVLGKQDPQSYERLTAKITEILARELSIDPARIYVAYAETNNWGWSGNNF